MPVADCLGELSMVGLWRAPGEDTEIVEGRLHGTRDALLDLVDCGLGVFVELFEDFRSRVFIEW
jgi:hypothetical protein